MKLNKILITLKDVVIMGYKILKQENGKYCVFSSIVDDSVQFYWDMLSKDTLCENAKLHFERIPARLECRDCGHQFTIEDGLQELSKRLGIYPCILDACIFSSFDSEN